MLYFTRKNFLSLLLFLTVSFSAFAQAVVTLDQKKDACDVLQNGSIRVTVVSGVAPLSYFYLGLGFGQSGSGNVTVGVPVTITGLQADNYVFVMNDGDPASNYNTIFTINNTPTPLAGSVDAVVNNSSCSAPNGSISITASGGSGSGYSYSWTGPNAFSASTDDITALVGGTYTVTISDNGTNCTRTISRTITDPSPNIYAITTASPTVVCPSAGLSLALGNSENGVTYTVYNNGGSTGITATGNGSPLSFAIPAGSFVNGDVFTIRATNGFCTPQVMTGSVTVNIQNLVITVNSNTQNRRCVAPFDGAVDISLSGTTNAVTYAWSGPGGPYSTQDLSAVQNGAYTVTATDNVTGCSVTSNINVADGRPILALTNTSVPNTRCISPFNGSINLTVSNSIGAPTFVWTGPTTIPANTEDPTALDDGPYTVTVTDPTSGCTTNGNITVADGAPTITISSAVTPNTKCVAPFTGAINITVGNAIGTPTFVWTGPTAIPANTEDPTALDDGAYTVTVTDPASGCTATANITVTDGAPVLSLSATVADNTKCVAPSNGGIDLSVTGGGPGYTYLWSNGATTQDLSGVVSGSYSVTVTDTNSGCTATGSYTVNDTPLSVNATPTITDNTRCLFPFNGAISLNVTGGGPGYTYIWSGPSPFSSTSKDISGLQPGSYNVTITETATGCTATLNNLQVNDTPPTISITGNITDNTRCVTPFNGAVDITVTGGTAYTYKWVSSVAGFPTTTTQDISGLESGTYTVTVTETATGCTATEDFAVGNVTPTLALSSTSTDNTRCVTPFDGAIDLTVAGGSGTYSYAWTRTSGGFNASTQDISGLPAGTYNVTVTDTPSGCTATLSATVVDSPPTITITNSKQPNTRCVAPFNGSIDITIGGTATGPFSYAWSGPGLSATTQDVSNLRDGTYNVVVTDQSTGCTASASIVVNPATPTLTLSRTITNNTHCVGPFNGSITITPGGAPGPFAFTYLWSNGATTQNISGLGSGSYTVTVTDTNSGCTTSATYNVGNTLPTIGVAASITNNTHCAAPFNGGVDITLSGTATGPFNYSWTNSGGTVIATTQDITGVQNGQYTVLITDTSTGCTATRTYNVGSNLPTITINQTITANTACAAPYNGAINITVAGGSGAYTYLWSNGATTEDISAVQDGNYTVTVTDTNNGCTQTKTITVPKTTIAFSAAAVATVNTRCVATFNGTVTLTVTGGVGPFTYLWNNGATTQNLANLPAGTYSVTVTDQTTNCQVTASATVTDNLPVISISNTPTANTRCVLPFNGAIDITATGGTAPYNYSWTSTTGFTSNSEDISALRPGDYTVVVTDPASGCTRSATITILDQAPAITVSGTLTANTRCATPFNGKIDITPAGGTAPYNYSWTGPSFTANVEDISGLAPGDYTVVVTDPTSGCFVSATYKILDNAPTLALSANLTHNTSCTTSNGAIDLSVTPAAGTYSYVWSGASSATTQDITGLAPGVYNVTVTDTNTGCTASASYTIQNNVPTLAINLDALVDNTRCVTPFNGSIKITATGGTGTLSYAWSGTLGYSAITDDISNLPADVYTVIVTDAGSGCTATASYTIHDNSSPLSINIDSFTDNTRCATPFNGAISVTVSGSTGPFTYAWTRVPAGFTASTEDLTNLAPGNYTLLVTDNITGCTATVSQVINDNAPSLSITNITVIDNTACIAPFNGSINIDISGGTGPYTYAWSNGATTEDISGLDQGTYVITVTETSTGCKGTASIDVHTTPSTLDATTTSTNNTRCTAPYDGTIDLTVTGSTGPFSYSWTKTGSTTFTATTEDLSGLQDGQYTVVITDQGTGCKITRTQIVNITPPIVFTITGNITDNTKCVGPFDGAIDIDVTPASTYTFLWTGPTPFTSTSEDITGLATGDYTVEVTDVPSGCKQTATFHVDDATPVISVVLDSRTPNTVCLAPFTGSLSITASGGSNSFSYAWTGPGTYSSTSEDITALLDGDYTVTVTDLTLGCKATQLFTVIDNKPVITLPTQTVVDNTSCVNPFNGSITVAAGGTSPGPFTYTWTSVKGYTGSGATITGLAPDDYTVTVTDGTNGCSKSFPITVNDDAPSLTVTLDAKTANTQCQTPFDGSISVSVAGSAGPFDYLWSGPGTFSATTEDLTAIEDGNYTITVTDTNTGCKGTLPVTVDDNKPVITVTADVITPNTACTTPFNGAITVSASGTAGPYDYTWTGPNTYTGTGAAITDLEPGDYIVTVKDQNLGCTGTLLVKVPNGATGGSADAGDPTAGICAGATYTFTDATIANATSGTWSLVTQPTGGDGVLTPTGPMTDPSLATFTATVAGPYVIRLTANTAGGACATGTDDITINVSTGPTAPVSAGTDQLDACGYTTLAGSSPAPGTGVWTANPGDGKFLPDATRPDAKFGGSAGVAYTLRWTVTNGACVSFDEVTIQFNPNSPSPADAGPDRRACFPNPTNMLAVDPTGVGEFGTWTMTPNTGTISDLNNSLADVNGVAGEVYTLIWKITNPAAPAGCNVSADTALVFIDASGPLANAGSYDLMYCGGLQLKATNPGTTATGLWTIVSGPAGASIDSPTLYNSNFSGPAGDYVLQWELTNACGNSQATASFKIQDGPTTANAGNDQSICANTTTLQGNTPASGTGTWTIVSGTIPPGQPFAPDANTPGATFTGIAGQTYVLRWTISKAGCTDNTDDVTIIFNSSTSLTVSAGADQHICGTDVILNADPLTGTDTGQWTILGANNTLGSVATPGDPHSNFHGTAGQVFLLRWELTHVAGGCTSKVADTVQITLDAAPTPANAGPNQPNVCGPAQLAANTPTVGNGAWTTVSGTPIGNFSGVNDPNSTYTGTAGVTYVLQWTITSGVCTPSTSTVTITFDPNSPTPANAGLDQSVCGTSTRLAGNAGATGETGTWTIISGTVPPGQPFSPDANTPNATFTGIAGQTYDLVWTIVNTASPVGCSVNEDHVSITFNTAGPTIVDAGPPQTICGTTVGLAGNDPAPNLGLWTVAGTTTGGSFIDDTRFDTDFTGTPGKTYTLYWTIRNGCGSIRDSVDITLDATPTTANAGLDQPDVCGHADLAANTPASGNGVWTIQSSAPAGATGTFSDANSATSDFTGTAGTTYILRWTISSGSCTDSFDEVSITFNANSPTPANAGPDQRYCAATSVSLAGNTPGTNNEGTWSIISTPADGTIAGIHNPASSFTPGAATSYTLVWSIRNLLAPAGCSVNTDTVTLDFDSAAPTGVNAGPSQRVCGNSVTLAGSSPGTNDGAWTVFGGTPTGGNFTAPTSPTSTFTGTAGQTYILQWRVSNACGAASDTVKVVLEANPPAANAGPDQVVCSTATPVRLAATAVALPARGIWVASGGFVVSPTSPISDFIGLAGQIYTLQWRVDNGTGSACPAKTDEVIINFAAPPVAPTPAVTICVNNAAPTLTAVATGATSYQWYYYPTPASPRTPIAGAITGNYTPQTELVRTAAGSITYEVTALYNGGACESAGTKITVTVSDTGSCAPGGGGDNCGLFQIDFDSNLTKLPTCKNGKDGVIVVTVSNVIPTSPATASITVKLVAQDGTSYTQLRESGFKYTFSNLPPSNYILKVKNIRGDSCVNTTFALPLATVVHGTASDIVDATCPGESTGQARLTIAGGNSPYEYTINGTDWIPGFISGNVITDLPSTGKYNIAIRDDNTDSCPDTVSVTINSPAPITHAIANLTPITECNGTDGGFTVSNIQGGTGAYNIRLLTQNSGGALTIVRDFEPVTGNEMQYENLPQGSYIIVIEDANGCTVNTSAAPTTVDAPGAIDFTVLKLGDANCSKNAKSGRIRIHFAVPGSYLVGISRNQTIEPVKYQPVNYNLTDPDIEVDTLSNGNYFIFAKPAVGTVCPSVRTITGGPIGGAFAVNFATQRVCNTNGAAALNITNIKGDTLDANATVTIKVFRQGDDVNPVEVITMPNLTVNKSIQLVYNPSASPSHDFLTQPDSYYIELSQKQGGCTITSNRILYRVTSSMTILLDNIRASLPEPRQTGGFTLKDIVGGYPSGSAGATPFYNVSIIDPTVDNVVIGPLEVPRNAQGVYQYDFKNVGIGTYRVLVTDSSGCQADTLVIVPPDTRIIIPNVFTPNNDDVNDTFEIVNLPITGKHKLVITNRWGNEVFSSSDYHVGNFWTAEGASEGIYFYRLQVEGGSVYTGWVEIIIGTKP